MSAARRNLGLAIGRRRSAWARVALLLVLAFLGHDLLMAAEGRGAAAAATISPPPSVVHFHGEDVSPSRGDAPLPAHPASCGVVQTVAPRIANAGELLGLTALPNPVARDLDSQRRVETRDASWSEPRWPPDTQRAFIQVFRI